MSRSNRLHKPRFKAGPAVLLGCALVASLILSLVMPTAVKADAEFSIAGRGWGHGIGLSQWGAQGYAENHGWDYERILTHYFQKTSIGKAPLALTVKVNLDRDAKARTSWKIRSGSSGRPLILVDSSSPSSRVALSATAQYWITVFRGNVRVHSDSKDSSGASAPGTVIKTFSGAAYASTGGSWYLVQMLSTSGPFSGAGIRWRGNIHFNPSGTSACTAINYVGMEQYLYGVVPRESPASFHPEALKAQAVAARSYAYTSADKGQTLYCTVQSQVYNGHARWGSMHEDARTNAAVNATRQQVVKYGSAVVRTFFSSSAGGHTANVEDVWVVSEPKPYYVGVPSADGPYPNGTSWGAAVKLSGSALATKMRSYDYSGNRKYDYSVAAPATVASITEKRASSGFVHHVVMRWSNGSVFEIRGTTFQSALGLKSTKFFIGVDYPPPLTARRYQETDPRIAYGGSWAVSKSSRLLGGAQVWSQSSGASATVSFKGSGMKWVGNKAPHYGRANIYVDGSYDKTVDLYASKPSYQRALWSVGGLSADVTHTVEIRVIESRNRASSGYVIALDAVDIYDGSLVPAPQPVVTAEEDDPKLAFAGDWLKTTNIAASGDAYVHASDVGARAVVTFFGRGIRWVGSVSPSGGTARVSVDGGAFQQVSLRSELTQYQKVVWSNDNLPLGRHTVIIEVAKPATPALAGPVPLDAIEVVGGALQKASVPWQRIEQTDGSVTWAGAWATGRSSVLSNGSQRYSSSAAARATFHFSGTSVRWIGSRSPAFGKASISIDGGTPMTIDLYAARPAYRQVLFGRSGLSDGPHTLAVRVLGSSRSGAKGAYVSVDAFDVVGVRREP